MSGPGSSRNAVAHSTDLKELSVPTVGRGNQHPPDQTSDVPSTSKHATPTLGDAVISAVKSAAEDSSETSMSQHVLVVRGLNALTSLMTDKQFAAKVSEGEMIEFLRADCHSIEYVIRLASLQHLGASGATAAFKAAHRTVQENQAKGHNKEKGNFIGHLRELEFAELLCRQGYRIEGLSERVSCQSSPSLTPEFDIVATKAGKKFFIEVKNSVEALHNARKSEDRSQLADQMYVSAECGATLVIAIADGRRASSPPSVHEHIRQQRNLVTGGKSHRYAVNSSFTIPDPVVVHF